MKYNILFVGIGGMLGSIARYLTTVFFTKMFISHVPYGTFAVNILGCLVIGFIYGLALRFSWLTPEWRLFLATGICGGYTTFSSFALENVQLLQQANYTTFALYSIASFILGLAAVFGGIALTKFLFPAF